jgi:uncharacterized glyoxalase superfamily protein PhnB
MSVQNVYPAYGYRDAREAIRWLGEAFGLEEQMVVPGEGDRIAHAELRIGAGIVMLGSRSASMRFPDATRVVDSGGADFSEVPYSIYIAVEDPDAHFERASTAGARIVREPYDTEYGSREYTALDLEDNVWTFGTYQPIAGE